MSRTYVPQRPRLDALRRQQDIVLDLSIALDDARADLARLLADTVPGERSEELRAAHDRVRELARQLEIAGCDLAVLIGSTGGTAA